MVLPEEKIEQILNETKSNHQNDALYQDYTLQALRFIPPPKMSLMNKEILVISGVL